jgi:hypothetical protein
VKMTELRGVVGVRGQSARSRPRRLDWGIAWTEGAGQHGVHVGQCGVHTGW